VMQLKFKEKTLKLN